MTKARSLEERAFSVSRVGSPAVVGRVALARATLAGALAHRDSICGDRSRAAVRARRALQRHGLESSHTGHGRRKSRAANLKELVKFRGLDATRAFRWAGLCCEGDQPRPLRAWLTPVRPTAPGPLREGNFKCSAQSWRPWHRQSAAQPSSTAPTRGPGVLDPPSNLDDTTEDSCPSWAGVLGLLPC